MGRKIKQGEMNSVGEDQATEVHRGGTGLVQLWDEWEKGGQVRAKAQGLAWFGI